jgi:hypothetical protein
MEVARVFAEGEKKYGRDAWRQQSVSFLLCHAVSHIGLWFRGDRSEPHLSHAACNLLMAMEVARDQ